MGMRPVMIVGSHSKVGQSSKRVQPIHQFMTDQQIQNPVNSDFIDRCMALQGGKDIVGRQRTAVVADHFQDPDPVFGDFYLGRVQQRFVIASLAHNCFMY
jgi:hypothetical protein